MSDVLTYRRDSSPDDLQPGECVIRKTVDTSVWVLWFCALRDADGQQELFAVPVNPNGPYLEKEEGVRRRTWGLMKQDASTWQISPSIHFVGIWHHTPKIIGVPSGEAWQ
jgi:hypothetical protein